MSKRLFKFTAYLEVQRHDLTGDEIDDMRNLHDWVLDSLSSNPAVQVGSSSMEPFKCDPCDCGGCEVKA